MINYDEIINALEAEAAECNYRYNGMVPVFYQRELGEAAAALIKCRECLQHLRQQLRNPQIGGVPHDSYKITQLMKMLSHETSLEEEHYGARLHHSGGDTKVLTIDAGGLRALISHYATHKTDLENESEEG